MMNKTFTVLAALMAMIGSACAQSSVTVFGVVDVGVTSFRGNGRTITGSNNSGDLTSRLGFRGTEDLGDGLKAGFWLESPFEPDTGFAKGTGYNSFSFGARSTVSLIGAFGELRLGRDTSRAYEDIARYDTFLQAGIGESFAFGHDGSPLRYSNMLAWFSPWVNGFHGAVDYAFGSNTGDSNGDTYIPNAGGYLSVQLGYDKGPLSVSFAVEQMNGPITPGVTSVLASEINATNLFSRERSAGIAASYDFGSFKLSGILRQQRNDFTAAGREQRRTTTAYLGAAIPFGIADTLKLAVNFYDMSDVPGTSRQFAVGWVHNLSKRTVLYGQLATMDNSGQQIFGLGVKGIAAGATLAAGRDQSAASFGVRHSF